MGNMKIERWGLDNMGGINTMDKVTAKCIYNAEGEPFSTGESTPTLDIT